MKKLLRHLTGAKDVTAQPVSKNKKSNLTIRIVSSIVMMPIVIFITYLGYPYFNWLVGICSVLIAWEYAHVVSSGKLDYAGKVLTLGLVLAVMLASTSKLIFALISLGAMAVIILCIDLAKKFVSRVKTKSPEKGNLIYLRSLWIAAGGIYMGGSCVGLVWIRSDLDNGLIVVLWMLLLVWASDCGAYAVGRIVGGPKLAPKISPNKTWAGLAGCIISAGIAGAIVAQRTVIENFYEFIVLSGLIGLVSQMGDLLESAFKRYHGVKDSGNLIPGHGGVLDRVDALLAAIIAVVFISLISEGYLLS